MLKHCTKTRDRQPGLFCDVCHTPIRNAAMARKSREKSGKSRDRQLFLAPNCSSPESFACPDFSSRTPSWCRFFDGPI